MAAAGNRRGFLKETFLGAARTTVDAATTVHSARTEIKKAVLPGLYDAAKPAAPDDASSDTALQGPAAVPTRPAMATSRTASLDDLTALAADCDLSARSRELIEAAQHSVRLTTGHARGAPGGRSRIGGSAVLPADHEWPTRQGRRLEFVAQLDLAALSSLELGIVAPNSGLLLFFFDVGDPVGTDSVDAEAARVLHVTDARTAADATAEKTVPFLEATPVRLSGELVLPRPWSARVERLELESSEREAWSDARELLAQAQGIELDGTSGHAIHRMLGYPEDTRGYMPLACELSSLGLARENTPPYMNPDSALAEATADRWRLLLQISSDDDLGCSWGHGRQRLYFWIAEEDLQAYDFSRVFGILG